MGSSLRLLFSGGVSSREPGLLLFFPFSREVTSDLGARLVYIMMAEGCDAETALSPVLHASLFNARSWFVLCLSVLFCSVLVCCVLSFWIASVWDWIPSWLGRMKEVLCRHWLCFLESSCYLVSIFDLRQNIHTHTYLNSPMSEICFAFDFRSLFLGSMFSCFFFCLHQVPMLYWMVGWVILALIFRSSRVSHFSVFSSPMVLFFVFSNVLFWCLFTYWRARGWLVGERGSGKIFSAHLKSATVLSHFLQYRGNTGKEDWETGNAGRKSRPKMGVPSYWYFWGFYLPFSFTFLSGFGWRWDTLLDYMLLFPESWDTQMCKGIWKSSSAGDPFCHYLGYCVQSYCPLFGVYPHFLLFSFLFLKFPPRSLVTLCFYSALLSLWADLNLITLPLFTSCC